MKKFLAAIVLLGAFFTSPILMDHARDIYLEEVVSKKAMPVKLNGSTIASSFQLEWKGKRVTVTNNHVCSVMEEVQRRKDSKEYNDFITNLRKYLAKFEKLGFKINQKMIKEIIEKARKKYGVDKEYPVVGQTMVIGDTKRKILYNSPNHDICFLEPVGSKSFDLASSVHRGERVTIIGHPRGVSQSMTDGRIVGEAHYRFPWIREAGKVRYLRSTALAYPGNSGSPVVNRYGNVVGILFAGRDLSSLNINCVVPVEYIVSDLNSYFNTKK